MKRAFTLVELLVVVGIISVIMAILLPTVLRTQRHAQAVAGTANLRSLSQVMSMYSSGNDEAFLNPFGGGGQFYHAQSLKNPELQWNFNSPLFPPGTTEHFAYYWYSYLADADGQGRFRDEQFSPADGWMLDLKKAMGKRDETRMGLMLWPSSFLYSPTFFSDSGRFTGGIRSDSTALNIRTQFLQSVSYPSSKVILFERSDFDQRDRITLTPDGSRKKGRPPAWNNIRSNTAVATVDGSVREIDMADVYSAGGDSMAFNPSGSVSGWDRPGLMAPVSDPMLPHGAGMGSDGAYPAFFWATFEGIEGRDLPG